MPNFTAGTSFTDGVTNDVTAAKLNALIADAVPTSSLSLNSTTGTISNFTSSTANVTNGTITNLTNGTTTGTAATFTTGTLTTGVIPTLTSTTLITSGTGTASSPAIQPTGDTNTGIFFPAADTIAFSEGGTESMRIDSSGNVGIGNSSPVVLLDLGTQGSKQGYLRFRSTGSGSREANIYSPSTGGLTIDTNSYSFPISMLGSEILLSTGASGTERLRIDSSGRVGIGTTSPTDTLSIVGSSPTSLLKANSTGGAYSIFQNSGGEFYVGKNDSSGNTFATDSYANIIFGSGSRPIVFGTSLTERLRIDSSGNVIIGKTAANSTVVGAWINTNGRGLFTSDADAPLYANRLTNDGTLVEFQQANTLEGTISVSGTTVSYNGGHLSRFSQLPSGQRDPAIKKGTVLSNLDEMCVWNDAEGNPLPNEQLNRVKISDVEGDSNVAGVFVNWDNDDQDNPFDLNMAMTGDMIIRIAQGVTVNRGDLLMSAGDGTAKPQGDDIRKAKTIAKVTSTNVSCTYEDGSYCVPCVLMAC